MKDYPQNTFPETFNFRWKPIHQKLDREDSLTLVKQIYDVENQSLFGDTFLIDLTEVRFVTLYGALILTCLVSRALSKCLTIYVSVPLNDSACGFLKHFGLGDLLEIPRQARVAHFNKTLSGNTPRTGKRVFHSKPIYKAFDSNQFINISNIRDWINQLPEEIRDCEFFNHGRFARIVAAEMATNIVQHAKLPIIDIDGREAFGVVGMRIIKATDDPSWVTRSFSEFKDFVKTHLTDGFVEICICDAGCGMQVSLHDAFESRLCKVPKKGLEGAAEILEFAFDELGTRKGETENWVTDAHALSRILGLVRIYGGILEVVSNDVRLVYRLDKYELAKNLNGIGYQSNERVTIEAAFGTFFRILIPLTKKVGSQLYINPNCGKKLYNPMERYSQVVYLGVEFSPADLETPTSFIGRAETLGKYLHKKISDVLIFDLTGASLWKSDHIATLIDRIHNFTIGKAVVFVGVPSSLANEVEERVFDSVKRVKRALSLGATDENLFDSTSNFSSRYFLGCLLDLYQLVLCIDAEGRLYWYGAPEASLAVALTSLIEKAATTKELFSMVVGGEIEADSNISETTITNFLLESPLFNSSQKDGTFIWECILSGQDLDNLRKKPLINHLRRHLYEISDAFWGGNNAYLLPHSKKYVKWFIEGSRILQEEAFSLEVGEILARLIWTTIGEVSPSILICTTAPSLLLANSIRQWMDTMPLIIDAGHYFDVSKRSILKSLASISGDKKIVIIQDLLHYGDSLKSTISSLKQSKIDVAGIACLLELDNSDEPDIRPGTLTKLSIDKEEIPLISLFRAKRPPVIENLEQEKYHDNSVYWVEPYSMHPFKMASLRNAHNEYLLNSKTIATKPHDIVLADIEKADALRVGHFVYENHHFSIVTKMGTLFEHSDVADKIVDDIVDACKEETGQIIIIYPLHSNIRMLTPKIKDKMGTTSKPALHMFAILARELGAKPYYMMPYRLEKLLKEKAKQAVTETSKGFSIIIIDDTTATLRAFETLLRSLYLTAGTAGTTPDDGMLAKVISNISVWAIVNRTGRAKSTFLHSVRKWFNVPFTFRCFCEYDVPIYDLDQCPLCEEYKQLTRLKKALTHVASSTLNVWLNERQEVLKPIIVDTPMFNDIGPAYFPRKVFFSLDKYKTQSFPVAYLVFLEIAERGCPSRYLLSAYAEFTTKYHKYLDDPVVKKFRTTISRWFVRNWRRIASDASEERLFSIIQDELKDSRSNIIDILQCASIEVHENLPLTDFNNILEMYFKRLNMVSNECKVNPTETNMEKRETLFNAIILSYSMINLDDDKSDLCKEFITQAEILPDFAGRPGDFQGSVRQTLLTAFTFIENKKISFLESLKIASMELLVSPGKDPKAGRNHSNRIYKHLKEIISPDREGEQFEEKIHKIIGSSGFLEHKSRILCECLEIVSENLGQEIKNDIIQIREAFKTLVNKLSAIPFDTKGSDIIVHDNFSEAVNLGKSIDEKLFSPTSNLYKVIIGFNINYHDVITEVKREIDKRGYGEGIKICGIDIRRNFTVFAEHYELYNLITNHTIDVIKVHPHVKIELNIVENIENEFVDLQFVTHDQTKEAFNNMKLGHSIRFERWGLKSFGATFVASEEISDYDYRVTLSCRLIKGYS